ncbi:MAG: HlyD family efflux transporter periplasmic adaptor subunit [Cytophagales bacterium]|nr:MAG: HlyD family efflux transporter periplasmic adaptor subunit [Cytophagales bacterium]
MKTLLPLGLVALLLTACQNEPKEAPATVAPPKPIRQVIGIARIEPEAGLIDIYAGAAGRIMARTITENQVVGAGQVLLTLDANSDRAQIAQAQAKIGTQQATIATNEAQLATLKATANKAQADVELNQKLLTVKGITSQTLRDSEANAEKLRLDYQKGQADLAQTRAKLAELNADVQYYQTVTAQKTVKAPQAGKLLEWKADLGDYVTANTAVAQFAPNSPLTARTEVDELFAERVKIGQRATIRSQATGKTLGQGTVYFLADFLKKKSLFSDETTQEDRRVREVRIRLDDGANVLINGRVDCVISVD